MSPETKATLASALLSEESKLLEFAKKQEFPVDQAFRNYALNFQSVELTSCLRAGILASFCGALIFYLDQKYGECCAKSSRVQIGMNTITLLMSYLREPLHSDEYILGLLERLKQD